jgi:hypothetical protein
MREQLNAFLAMYSRESRENVLCLRNLILEVFPGAVEDVDPKSGLIAYGVGGKGYQGLVLAIMPHMKHVNLMFSKGAQLPDSDGLLTGTGKQARHVRITSEAETQNPTLKLLITKAIELNKQP